MSDYKTERFWYEFNNHYEVIHALRQLMEAVECDDYRHELSLMRLKSNRINEALAGAEYALACLEEAEKKR